MYIRDSRLGIRDSRLQFGLHQSTTPSMNHASVSRSRKTRYVEPSLSVTSHSSRSQYFFVSSTHQPPDVRHGPAYVSTLPPLIPRRSLVTRTGMPRSTRTRAGIGKRKRRIASLGA